MGFINPLRYSSGLGEMNKLQAYGLVTVAALAGLVAIYLLA
jgi:hypothetical protein